MKYKYIQSDPAIMEGKARLKGTHISMDMVMACGLETCEEKFREDYPEYSEEPVKCALDEVARNIDRWVQNDINNYQRSHWFVTAIKTEKGLYDKHEESVVSSRTFGFLPTFEMADDAVLTNDGDIHEETFKWVVVEEIEWGTLAMSLGEHAEQWYVWNDVYKKYHQTYKPDWSRGVINWAIG